MSKNNKPTSNLSNDKHKLAPEQPLENVKSKYVLANTIKANKISTKLSKSLDSVVSNKNFVGYDENDYERVEKLCEMNNVNLFVKNESKFFADISCEKNLYIKSGMVGYSQAEYNDLNNDTNLHVKGDSELNGNLFVYQNINSDKNINVQQSVNIGFENELLDNTSKLNVNGNSEFVGDNVVYGSEYIKNNLIVNDKANFYNDIFMSNSICLKKEIIDDVTIVNNVISGDNYKLLLSNILTSIQNHDQSESSVLKFYSKKNNNIYSGLISASKKFIITNNSQKLNNTNNSLSTEQTQLNVLTEPTKSTEKILAFILVHGIYSNSKIISVKPVLDTFVLIDSTENIIKIGNVNIHTTCQVQKTQPIDSAKGKNNVSFTEDASCSTEKTDTNTSFISSSFDLLKNNKLINLLKTDKKVNENQANDSSLNLISNSANIQNNFKLSIGSSDDLNNCDDLNSSNDIFSSPHTPEILSKNKKDKKKEQPKEQPKEQLKKYEKNKKNVFNFDSELDLEAFEIIK